MENAERERLMILNEADLLGEMIRRTPVYREYAETLEELDRSTESRENLHRYSSLAADIQARQKAGVYVEPFEFEDLRGLADLVSSDPLAMSHARAREEYINLLEALRREFLILDDQDDD